MNRRPFTLNDYRKRYGSSGPDRYQQAEAIREENRRMAEVEGARERQLIAEAETIAARNRVKTDEQKDQRQQASNRQTAEPRQTLH